MSLSLSVRSGVGRSHGLVGSRDLLIHLTVPAVSAIPTETAADRRPGPPEVGVSQLPGVGRVVGEPPSSAYGRLNRVKRAAKRLVRYPDPGAAGLSWGCGDDGRSHNPCRLRSRSGIVAHDTRGPPRDVRMNRAQRRAEESVNHFGRFMPVHLRVVT